MIRIPVPFRRSGPQVGKGPEGMPAPRQEVPRPRTPTPGEIAQQQEANRLREIAAAGDNPATAANEGAKPALEAAAQGIGGAPLSEGAKQWEPSPPRPAVVRHSAANLADAAAQGKLTQEQADAVMARYQKAGKQDVASIADQGAAAESFSAEQARAGEPVAVPAATPSGEAYETPTPAAVAGSQIPEDLPNLIRVNGDTITGRVMGGPEQVIVGPAATSGEGAAPAGEDKPAEAVEPEATAPVEQPPAAATGGAGEQPPNEPPAPPAPEPEPEPIEPGGHEEVLTPKPRVRFGAGGVEAVGSEVTPPGEPEVASADSEEPPGGNGEAVGGEGRSETDGRSESRQKKKDSKRHGGKQSERSDQSPQPPREVSPETVIPTAAQAQAESTIDTKMTREHVTKINVAEYLSKNTEGRAKYLRELAVTEAADSATLETLKMQLENGQPFTIAELARFTKAASQELIQGNRGHLVDIYKLSAQYPEVGKAIWDNITELDEVKNKLKKRFPSNWEKVGKFAWKHKGWLAILLALIAGVAIGPLSALKLGAAGATR